MDFTNAQALLSICAKEKISISQAMIIREVEKSESSLQIVREKMAKSFAIMKDSVKDALKKPTKSMGGLIGGEAALLQKRRDSGKSVCGRFMSKAISYAMAVLETNASMGLIVAAPTAGSSGVIPGVLLSLQEEFALRDDEIIDALFNASAIGAIIAHNATVSGAQGGCQAEVGAACAMAASATVELMGGTPQQCFDAAGTAISNILGLVCDPIAGLVEVPCQARNAMGASNALISAEIAMCGIRQIIPFDEIVLAMYQVGKSLPCELRETALGGVAATKTGCRLMQRIINHEGV